jgi:hypothetical protein
MPGFDGTGPRGKGPLTGWRRGKCAEGKNEKELDVDQDKDLKEDLKSIHGFGRGRERRLRFRGRGK